MSKTTSGERSETEESYRILAETASDAIIRIDENSTIEFVNTAAERIFGYSKEEMVGQSLTLLMPEEMREQHLNGFARYLQTGERNLNWQSTELPARHKDGRSFPIEVSFGEFERDDKRFFIGIVRDITTRKKAEEQLRRNHETFFNLVQNAPFGIYVIDADFRLIQISAGSRKVFSNIHPLLGRDFAEILRTVWEEPFAGEAIEHFRHTLATGEPYRAANTTEHRGNITDIESYDWKIERVVLPDGTFGVVCYFYDLTEQRQTEQALRESEERFTKAFNSSPLVLTISSLDNGKLIEVNETFVNATGFSREEAIGRTTLELGLWTNPKDREAELGIIRNLGKLRNVEYSFRTRSGAEIIGLLSAERIEIGGESFALTVIQDITERKRAEKAAAHLAAIVESSDDAIVSKDLNGIVLSWNKGAENLFGYRADEIIGKSITILIPPRLPDEEPQILKRIRRGEKILHYETVRQRKTGSEILVSLSVSPVFDDAGKIIGVSKIARDITERKQIENEIQLISRMPAENPNPVMRVTPDGEVLYFNDASIGLLNFWKRQDGRTISGELLNYIKEAFESGSKKEFEIKYDRHILFCTLAPVLEAGYVNFYGNDITARKNAEAEREWLLANEQKLRKQAEEANRLKDEFLATVSHELRTPLNAILGWATMVRKSGFETETMRRAFEVVERNSRNQNQIISDILDVSRIITGKLSLNLRALQLTPIIRAAIDTLYPAIEAKHIKLETNLETGDAKVMGDDDRLQQIIWNLLSNAVKFTPDGGTIEIALRYEKIFAEIVVKDSGDGIKTEFLPFVFDRFRQGDGNTNRRHGGLGLGLSIVRNLVELHGGGVLVESEGDGQGTAFSVRLPLKVETAETAVKAEDADNTPRRALENLKILVVDDERDALELAAFILKGEGAQVFTAESVDEALKIFDAQPFDAVVSDIGMPEKDGFNLIREIKERTAQTNQTIPTVALTAYAGEEDNRRFLQAGYQAYIPKPLEPSMLIEIITEVTDNAETNSE